MSKTIWYILLSDSSNCSYSPEGSSSSQSSSNQKNLRFCEVIVVLYLIKTSFPCQFESGALNSPTSTRRHVTNDPLCQVFSVVSLLLRRDNFAKSRDAFTSSDHLKNISMNISQVKNALEASSPVMTICCQSGICKIVSRIFDKSSKFDKLNVNVTTGEMTKMKRDTNGKQTHAT